MNYITVEAKTLDEAISKAMMELGTSSDNIEYEITEKGSSGFLGLFSKKVIIRARKKKEDDLDELYAAVVEGRDIETKSPKKEEKKEIKKEAKKEQPEKEQVKEEIKETVKEQPKEQKKEVKKETKKDNYKEFKTEFKTESKYEVKSLKGKELPKSNKNTEKKGPRNIMKEPKPQTQEPAREKAPKNFYRDEEALRIEREKAERERAEKERKERENRKPINVEACQNAAKTFLTQVLGAMGMNVEIDMVYDDEERELTVNLSGDDMGILIGKRGQTLDSLQYLVSLIVNKQTEGYLRVKLDTENYRARRKSTLEELAKNIAYKVKRTRRSVSLEPMNPYERRIIHSALQNNKYVYTRSEGEDPYRHVVVSLKKDFNRDRKSKYNNRNNNMTASVSAAPEEQNVPEESED